MIGILLVCWATSRYGIGVSPDSAHYIGAARSLAAGHGLSFNGDAFTHWPPVYPLALAAFGAIHVEPLQAARVLAAALIAINSILVACVIGAANGRLDVRAVLGALVFVLTPELLLAHTMAWSEPLFYALSLLSLLTFLQWERRQARWLLFAAGLITG